MARGIGHGNEPLAAGQQPPRRPRARPKDPPPAGDGEPGRAREELDLEAIEIRLLLDGVFEAYSFDFRGYSMPSLKRRLRNAMEAEHLATISALQDRVLHDHTALERLVAAIGVHTTALFRDPAFYRVLRSEVVPVLHTYPSLRIWCAGCSTGEEVYSLAILLHEEGLYERSIIYATDMSGVALTRAREGVVPLSEMKTNTANYQEAGGKATLSDYYTAAYGNALFRQHLKQNLAFFEHWLTTEWAFNTFHLVLCRNVLIYFGHTLRDRVLELLHESIEPLGYLGLGERESLHLAPHADEYAQLQPGVSLYRRLAR